MNTLPFWIQDEKSGPRSSAEYDAALKKAGLRDRDQLALPRDVWRADGTVQRIWMYEDDPRQTSRFDEHEVSRAESEATKAKSAA